MLPAATEDELAAEMAAAKTTKVASFTLVCQAISIIRRRKMEG
jgi:hypothetical protein